MQLHQHICPHTNAPGGTLECTRRCCEAATRDWPEMASSIVFAVVSVSGSVCNGECTGLYACVSTLCPKDAQYAVVLAYEGGMSIAQHSSMFKTLSFRVQSGLASTSCRGQGSDLAHLVRLCW